jgi:hypothetical protein
MSVISGARNVAIVSTLHSGTGPRLPPILSALWAAYFFRPCDRTILRKVRNLRLSAHLPRLG